MQCDKRMGPGCADARDKWTAAKLEPHGYWPHHAVSHVSEMTGRPDDGLKWMAEREALWYWMAKIAASQAD